MAINFTSLISKSTSDPKARLRLAIDEAIKQVGMKYYELQPEDQANLREKCYQKLFSIVDYQKEKEIENENQAKLAAAIHAVHRKNGEESITASNNNSIATIQSSPVVPFNDAWPIESEITSTQTADDKALAPEPSTELSPLAPLQSVAPKHQAFGLEIILNARQQMAADFASAGKCFVLTGAAGTGKTTACREIAKTLFATGNLSQHDFKLPNGAGRFLAPSIAFVAYTNRAADNMRRALHKDPELEETLSVNVLTIHRLLEYEPEFFDREDGTTGMKFVPRRHAQNPLRITHLVIEEASMVGASDLWLRLYEALNPGVQVIFVGDINQLPPIFSKSVLNYALIQLPVVELNEVYRQALDNPIIANAHRVLAGLPLQPDQKYVRLIQDSKKDNSIPSETTCVNLLVNSLKKWHDVPKDNVFQNYDPEQDIILCPYGKENKAKGSQANTTALNNHIAQFLGKKRDAQVFEIIAGMRKLYLAVGDRVMIEKQDGIIIKISHNAQYVGKMAQPASNELTRFGMRLIGSSKAVTDEDFDSMIAGYENLSIDDLKGGDDPDEKRVQQASHVIDVLMDTGHTTSLRTSGDYSESSFSLGYALTVHKSQGCEWRKVIILLHRNHAGMLNRELLYTAMTRAREVLIIVDLCNQVEKAIRNQRIKGNSVQDKIEWFNSEISLAEPIPVIP